MIKLEEILNQGCLDNLISVVGNGLKSGSILAERISKRTKHENYLIIICGEPRFVLKKTKYAKKEEKVYNILSKEKLFLTLNPVYFQEGIIVTEYEKQLTETTSPFDFVEDVAKNHGRLLRINLNYTAFAQDSDFRNKDSKTTIQRIVKHQDLVKNYFSDIDKLIKYIEANEKERDNDSVIMIHGDLNTSNVLKTLRQERLYLDFELSTIVRPTWDLARMIFGVGFEDVARLLEVYVPVIKTYSGGIMKDNYSEIKRKALADFICKFVSVGIGVQQHPEYEEYAKYYLNRIIPLFNRIINNA